MKKKSRLDNMLLQDIIDKISATCPYCKKYHTDPVEVPYIKEHGMCLVCDKMHLVRDEVL